MFSSNSFTLLLLSISSFFGTVKSFSNGVSFLNLLAISFNCVLFYLHMGTNLLEVSREWIEKLSIDDHLIAHGTALSINSRKYERGNNDK